MVPPTLACAVGAGLGAAAVKRWLRMRKLRHIPIAKHTYPLVGRIGTVRVRLRLPLALTWSACA